MMLWFILIAIAVMLLFAIILLGNIPRKLYEPIAATVILAMAGYAWQGHPNLSAAPAAQSPSKQSATQALIAIRTDMDQHFSPAKQWVIPADAFARNGDFELANSYLRAGLIKSPKEADIWSALGVQMIVAADGKMTLPAEYAFNQARKFDPTAPAPDYFKGLDKLFSGDVNQAISIWQDLLKHSPKDAKWAVRVAAQIKSLEDMKVQIANDQHGPD